MSPSSVVAFWGLTALLIVVPGADWAYAISAGLRRQAFPAAGGIVLGYLVMTAVVAGGLGVLITSTPVALIALTVAGGAYLIWLGVRTLRHPAAPGVAGDATGGRWRAVLRGMVVSGLNPKALMVFVAVLPQFTRPTAAWPVPVQMGVLGLTFTATCAVVYPCVGLAAQGLLRARPVVSRIVSRVSGASMVLVGGILLVSHVIGG